MNISNHLASIRRTRGVSVADLAVSIGVSRQTIYAIEAGTYSPNTAVALKLASFLGVSVEDLFVLSDIDKSDLRREDVDLLPGSETAVGRPLQVCRVGKRMVAASPTPLACYLPVGDAELVSVSGSRKQRASAQVYSLEDQGRESLLIAGCDPGSPVLEQHGLKSGLTITLVHRNSSEALDLLRRNYVHVAGSHLEGRNSLPSSKMSVLSLASWEIGILTRPGSQKSIRRLDDFARRDVQIANREKGSGVRFMLDAHLKSQNQKPACIRGYNRVAPSHLAAGWYVFAGIADAAIATRAIARALHLNFLPLLTEAYNLVVPQKSLGSKSIESLGNILCSNSFRRHLESLGGYDVSRSGQRLQ